MYIEMIETRSLKILLKSFHENYSDLFKKTTWYTSPKYYRVRWEIIFDKRKVVMLMTLLLSLKLLASP